MGPRSEIRDCALRLSEICDGVPVAMPARWAETENLPMIEAEEKMVKEIAGARAAAGRRKLDQAEVREAGFGFRAATARAAAGVEEAGEKGGETWIKVRVTNAIYLIPNSAPRLHLLHLRKL